MRKVRKLANIPVGSNIQKGFEEVHYHDTYQINHSTTDTTEQVTQELMTLPDWVKFLMILRNRIVGIFGLKTDKNTPKSGAFFSVIENRKEEIIMGENDKHLNFRASIMNNQSENSISLTTVIHFNNVWGRIYFFLVKPFHTIIMKVLLKRYLSKRQIKLEIKIRKENIT